MYLGEHELFLDSLTNVESCLPSKHARHKRHDSLEKLLQKPSLLPIERYKIDSFYWCDTCRYFFIRLDGIREMTTRSIYLRKGEEKDIVIAQWLLHNYHFYILVYQSGLDIALLLVNSMLDLGITYRNCNWAAIYENRKVRDSGLHLILKKLKEMTDEHHQSRNFLLHRGKYLYIPMTEQNTLDAAELAKRIGVEDAQSITFLEILLAPFNKNALLIKMDDEIRQLEKHFLGLFDKLLPIYKSNHRLYSN